MSTDFDSRFKDSVEAAKSVLVLDKVYDVLEAQKEILDIVAASMFHTYRLESIILPTEFVSAGPWDTQKHWNVGRIYDTELLLWRGKLMTYEQMVKEFKLGQVCTCEPDEDGEPRRWHGQDCGLAGGPKGWEWVRVSEVFHETGSDGHFELRVKGYRFFVSSKSGVMSKRHPTVPAVMLDEDDY